MRARHRWGRSERVVTRGLALAATLAAACSCGEDVPGADAGPGGGRFDAPGLDAPGLDAAGLDAPVVCAAQRVMARRVTPNVVLVIDQSGSMTEDFGGSNRWDALRDSLLAEPDGLIATLEGSVRFGVALFSSEAGDSGPAVGMCPMVTWVDPALDNLAAIRAVYAPADPIDETPTGESIDAVLERLAATPDPSDDPTILVLATDGEPDTCAEPNPQNGQDESIAAIERAYDRSIRTFVISVGNDVGMAHLQDVANAGIGRGAGDPDAPFWVAGDDEGLRTALTAIIGGELSCVVTLEGRIDDLSQACTGSVVLDGTALDCDDPDGWRAIDETHIELTGAACERLQSNPRASLEASFPCGVILI
jgi:hypothetical protein